MKWGLLGYGRIAKKFEQSINASSYDTIVAVASQTQYDKIPYQYRAYNTYEGLYGDEEVEIVYVCTTHNSHRDITINALTAGKHVLCEKPIAIAPDQVREMIAAAKINHRFLMEAIWSRFLPGYQKALEIIHSGKIGNVLFLQANFGFYMDPGKPKERLTNPDLAGGAIWDVGIYPISLALDIFKGMPIEIQSLGKLTDQNVEESALMQLRFEKDGLAQLSCSFEMNLPNKAWIIGSAGSVIMDNFWKCENVTLKNDQGTKSFYLPMTSTGYYHEIQACNRLIANNQLQSPLISWQDSININIVMSETIKRSKKPYILDDK